MSSKKIFLFIKKKRASYFQLNEIELADVNIKEEINLTNEYKKLNHYEDILSFLNHSKLKISHHEGIISDLNNIIVKLEQLKKYDSSLSKLEHSIDSVIYNCKMLIWKWKIGYQMMNSTGKIIFH